jgi:hypothetical protein
MELEHEAGADFKSGSGFGFKSENIKWEQGVESEIHILDAGRLDVFFGGGITRAK